MAGPRLNALGLTFLVSFAAFLVAIAVAFAGASSFRQRLGESASPQPSIRTRRGITMALTLVAVAAHLWTWLELRPIVPVGAKPGSVLPGGGPGDGFWLLFGIVAPWLLMLPINVGLACFCSRTVKQAVLVGCLLLAVWIGAAAVGAELVRCPDGFICPGG